MDADVEDNVVKKINPELNVDQTWKKIQQNTFTRWVNQHLRNANSSINNLETDLCDGIQLIRLAEVLSRRRLPRYNKNPTMRTQMLDNISLVLKFFQDEENVKIVNIDSMHIVDSNLKLILGLIYTLIMHYSISKATFGNTVTDREDKESPKKRLLSWIKSRLPSDVPVTNFTSDWNDGVALGALIDACVSGSCSNWRTWKPDNALQNTSKAMKVAERMLDIANLITPEELINPNVDEKSVMTYLSQFPQAKTKDQGRLTGVDTSPIVGCVSQFEVDLTREDLIPNVEIYNLHGDILPVKVEQNIIFTTRFNISYTPEQIGIHKIVVTASLNDSSKFSADFKIKQKIAEATINAVPAPQVIGLKPHTEIGDEERFRVINVPESRQLNLVVVDAIGHEFEVIPLERVGNACVCNYRPETFGLHSLNVFVDRRHIPGSPFPIRVINSATDKVVVWGRGIHPEGACAGDVLPIHVDACDRPAIVTVTTKEGLIVPINVKFSYLNSTPTATKESRQKPGHSGKTDTKNRRQTFEYIPRSAGVYRVEVKLPDSTHLVKSPYEIKVAPRNCSSVRAVGPGIEGGVKNQKSYFYVDTFGAANSLDFSIEGPNETQISCKDNGDSSAVVDYVPVSSGLYVINVLNNGNHIKDSPFVLVVDSDDDFSDKKPKIKGEKSSNSLSISSSSSSLSESSETNLRQQNIIFSDSDDGLNKRKKGFYVGRPVEFQVKNDNGRPLDVIIYGPDLVEIPFKKTGELAKNIYFIPEKHGKHIISVCCDGVAVPEWPYTINVNKPIDISQLRVYGSGVGTKNIFVGQRTSFTIDSQQVGSNNVSVAISDKNHRLLDDIILRQESNAGLHTVSYTPYIEGQHRIEILINDELVFDIEIDAEVKKECAEGTFPKRESERHINETTIHLQNQNVPELKKDEDLPLLHKYKNFDENQNCEISMVPVRGCEFKTEKLMNLAFDSSYDKQNILSDEAKYIADDNIALNNILDNEGTKIYTSALSSKISNSEEANNNNQIINTHKNSDLDECNVLKIRDTSKYSSNFEDNRKINELSSTSTQLQSKPPKFSVAEIPRTVVRHNASLYLKYSPQFLDLKYKMPLLNAFIEAPDDCEPKRIPIVKTINISSTNDSLQEKEKSCDQYRVDFYPEIEGLHLISVYDDTRNGCEIEGSPFHVSVSPLGVDEVYRITAHGSGLMTGQVGCLETFCVTLPPLPTNGECNAEISVTVDGPSRAEITLVKENNNNGKDGSTCRVEYRVDEPGLYNFDVRFNNALIAGSPFRIFIKPKNEENEPNKNQHNTSSDVLYNTPAKYKSYENMEENKNELTPSNNVQNENRDEVKMNYPVIGGKPHRVTAHGSGLNAYEVAKINSFIIDTSNAGIDLLFVGVVTSHGPCDEVFVRHEGQGTYNVDYLIRNSSPKVLIIIKYGDRQIPGSPFIAHPRNMNT